MVLVRYGNENKLKTYGGIKYHEDSVWSTEREANMRATQISKVGYYGMVTPVKTAKGEIEYIVWNNQSKRMGTKFAKKREARANKKKEE
jgi:hypothetical protein